MRSIAQMYHLDPSVRDGTDFLTPHTGGVRKSYLYDSGGLGIPGGENLSFREGFWLITSGGGGDESNV